jgi:hypothetical protein
MSMVVKHHIGVVRLQDAEPPSPLRMARLGYTNNGLQLGTTSKCYDRVVTQVSFRFAVAARCNLLAAILV